MNFRFYTPAFLSLAFTANIATPHIFVIDSAGKLRYMGGIDSIPSADRSDLAKATQFVPPTLAALANDDAVTVKSSQPYGCSVKY